MRVETLKSIHEIPQAEWRALADRSFPFLDYHFLRALETSGCLGGRTGWEPRVVAAWEGSKLLGAVVSYVKTNSYGEFIFDFAWAQAYQHSGLKYYPKLTSAIPFTPATGPKLLWREGADREAVSAALFRELNREAQKLKASSEHALFVPPEQIDLYEKNDFFIRHSYQFHWLNRGYGDFAQFLKRLRSKRRREIVREREQVRAAPVTIRALSGADLTPEIARAFYRFYLNTIDKRGSFDYLTEEFFLQVFATMGDKILLVMAFDLKDEPVAGALNYFDASTLYGRNWGCRQEYRALHFELCYYQGIDFAIKKGLKKFEAGAQGEHKFQRGFEPALTFSAHRIFHPVLERAIREHVALEKRQIQEVFEEYAEHDPYRREDGPELRG